MDIQKKSRKSLFFQYYESIVDNRFKCLFCQLILLNVHQADCGCRYCFDCLDEIYKKNECPNCNEIFQKKTKTFDKGFSKEINHITLKCSICNLDVKYLDFEKHYENLHSFSCEYCTKSYKSLAELNNHIDYKNGDCREKIYPCVYQQELNCKFLGKRKSLSEHLKESTSNHLNLMYHSLNKRIETIEKSMESKEVSAQRQTDYSMDSGYSSHDSTSMNESLNLQINEQSIIKKVFECMELVEKLQRDLIKTREKLQNKTDEVADLKKSIIISQVSLIQLEDKLISLERGSNNGVLIWKISNFKEKQNDARNNKCKSLYSPYFYSHHNGYKICSRIFLNGDDSSFGRNLSIFIVIMKGEYDQLLKWPFKQKITFLLIDQINNDFREHIVQSFRPDPNSESFRRPINSMNIASGIPMFCSLSKIDSQEHGYVKDDTMFIKVSIETHDLSETA